MSDFLFGKLYPFISTLAVFVFVVDLIIVTPLSLFKKPKAKCGVVLIYSSYVLGLQLWLSGLLLTLKLWGIWAAIIGILIFGVGVVPIALLATAFKGMWSEFFQLILSILIVFGVRSFGFFVISKAGVGSDES